MHNAYVCVSGPCVAYATRERYTSTAPYSLSYYSVPTSFTNISDFDSWKTSELIILTICAKRKSSVTSGPY